MQNWYAKKTLEAFSDEAAGRWSAREALAFAGQRWRCTQLRTEVHRTARALLYRLACVAMGLASCYPEPGDVRAGRACWRLSGRAVAVGAAGTRAPADAGGGACAWSRRRSSAAPFLYTTTATSSWLGFVANLH